MEEADKVILHGMWASPHSKIVELALKLKGIPYEYVDEDLSNKSELLLKYNPVHKKVPVLVHNGKPIAESHIILEYIDETWKHAPSFLPQDPYQRAKIRFWARYIQQQVNESATKMLFIEREAKERAIEDVKEIIDTLENGLKELYPKGRAPTNSESFGFLDIILVGSFGQYKIYEEVFGPKIIDTERNPMLFSWINAIKEVPLVKDSAPPPDKFRMLLQKIKETYTI